MGDAIDEISVSFIGAADGAIHLQGDVPHKLAAAAQNDVRIWCAKQLKRVEVRVEWKTLNGDWRRDSRVLAPEEVVV